MSKDELYLVDGSGFIFRAYFAMAYSGGSNMTNPEGVPIGAVYGFTNMMLKLLQDYNAPYMAMIFDAERRNFRNDIYADYKANRDDTPEDLIPQFPIIREAVKAFDIPCMEQEGYEADDLIAAYTKEARAQGKDVVIVSSDKDLMQLVGEGVRMLDPMKGVYVDANGVVEKFGVTPDKVVDVQALAGDSTDNVPGVPGIGVKTAALLINEFGSLENLLENAHTIKQNKRRESLIEHAEMARISKQLVKLDENAPMPMTLDDMKVHDPDKPELIAFLEKQGFKSILKRVAGGSPPNRPVDGGKHHEISPPQARGIGGGSDFPPVDQNTYTLINDTRTLQQWIDKAYETGVLAIDTETTGLTPAKADLVGISMACEVGKAAYIPLGHGASNTQAQDDLFGDTSPPSTAESEGGEIDQLPVGDVIALLKPLLEDDSVLKIGHNMKYDWQMLAQKGVHVHPYDDTLLLSYVLDGSSHSHGMDNLSNHYFDHQPIKYEDVCGKGKNAITFDAVPIDKALDYAAEDADITLRLHHVLKPRLAQEKMVTVYEAIERPLVRIIAEMERTGIRVDPDVLNAMSTEFGKKLYTLEQEIFKLAETEFNIGSPKQVGEVLYDQMGIEGGKKTKSGQYSTDVGVLEKLAAQGHEVVQKILDWRALSKLKSTYTDALQTQINPNNGRVHTSYNMVGTSTGRLSSSDPNLQNIPIRTEDGRRIREAFVAENGQTLLSVDYSQVELRLIAEMADVAALKQAFKDGVDIHALTASQVFDVPLDDITPDLRRQAKAVNFGIIYGISGWGLAKQLGTSAGEANAFITKYLNTFSEIKDFMEETKAYARQHGYVKTLYGRKCFVPYINDKNPMRKGGAERAAINAPIQGTAADIMKLAMNAMPRALSDANLKAKLLLQVHDELIFEVPDEELEATSALVKSTMENVVTLDVPLIAEVGSGTSWAAAH